MSTLARENFKTDSSIGTLENDHTKLTCLKNNGVNDLVQSILKELKEDQVVLIQNLSSDDADAVMAAVTDALNLRDELEIQAGFASVQGHRENVGRYYMSVNKREDYEFIPPHSEGTSSINMQLASFYCYENTTDGGESILFNIDADSAAWSMLKEHTKKVQLNRYFVSTAEVAQAKMMYQLDLENDVLESTDQVIEKIQSPVEQIELYEVLSNAKKTYSKIIDKKIYAYWDSVASVDRCAAGEYVRFLNQHGLLRQPSTPKSTAELDNVHERRVYDSGVSYSSLFKSSLIRKLVPGDFILMNNLTWAHSSNNWTPGSGVRRVSAAFA